jgi:DNA-binding response OmpR family regulator
MRQAMARVLIVEDDEAMSVALGDGFRSEGYTVELSRDGEDGLRRATAAPPDLMILDVMLPKMTGLDVCKRLRNEGSPVPILMLTARGQEIDKVLGLKIGADDYVTKPFGFMELMARAEALLRRARSGGGRAETTERLHFGDVEIDFTRHQARRNGDPLDLSPREFRLLHHFACHRGEVVTREQLLDSVWDYNAIPFTRTVDMHIAKLRKKIEPEPRDPRYLLTVHRIGYKFVG